jgi:mannose-6-phosphate isomerase
LKAYPEFATAVGTDIAKQFIEQAEKEDATQDKPALKLLFGALQRQSDSTIASSLDILLARIKDSLTSHDMLLKRLAEQYPSDVGIFCAFLLNYILLSPGQGIFLAANGTDC